MASRSEYHVFVRHLILASLALFGLLALPLILVSTSHAQINTGASVGSAGFGGHAVTGAVPSVTGPVRPPTGPVRPPTGTVPNLNSLAPSGFVPRSGSHHHRHHYGAGYPAVGYAVPVPYAVDSGAVNYDDNADDDDPDYQGGPTIFDRRGSGADSYIPPVSDVPTPHSAQLSDADSSPEPPQPPTLLVFKDGHTLEISNYAIVGATLFDLTPGHARKVSLADLDLDATGKQNDDRGVTFQLPSPSPGGN